MIDPVFIPFPRTWPVIKLGGQNITVVTQAKFLGRIDTLDTAIDIELEERLETMKATTSRGTTRRDTASFLGLVLLLLDSSFIILKLHNQNLGKKTLQIIK
jgi:hypothetical protein